MAGTAGVDIVDGELLPALVVTPDALTEDKMEITDDVRGPTNDSELLRGGGVPGGVVLMES